MVHRAIRTLQSLGAELRDVRIPSLQYMPLVDAAWVTEARPYLLPFALQGPKAFADEAIFDRIILAEFVRAHDTYKAVRLRSLICREFRDVMAEVDLLAMPTSVDPPFPIDAPAVGGATTALTAPLNLTGAPTISVPCGWTAGGLPVGLALAGRHWHDEVVLRAAYAYEQAATGGYRPAPIA
jgi:aspartyl-tRNA(Asn)/glutamyl-tRNA(Gln) amidotransferase subunit A